MPTWRALGGVAGGLLLATSASAQDVATPTLTSLQTDSALVGSTRVSPRGTLLRALAVPGWGHAAIGSHTRGAVYFAMHTATLFTYFRSNARLDEVRNRMGLRESIVRERLVLEGIEDPLELEDAIAQDDGVSALQALMDARKEQREDLIAFELFLILISSVDAYVSAHLQNFPEPLDLDLDLETAPAAAGGVELSIRLPLPR